MRFYSDCDVNLERQLNVIKDDLEYALELIEECNNSSDSDFSTEDLEKDIKRFLEDHC